MKLLKACKWAPNGCVRIRDRMEIVQHELKCRFRTVACNYDNCNWTGSLRELTEHQRNETCITTLYCIQQHDANKGWAFLEDYSDIDKTVFQSAAIWRPVMLTGTMEPFLIYIIFSRTEEGVWYVVPYSYYNTANVIDNMRITLNISQAPLQDGHEQQKQHYEFRYRGGINSSEITYSDAINSGNVLQLNDGQVKRMKSNNALFQYEAVVEINPENS